MLNGYLLTGPRVLYTLGQQKSILGYKAIGYLNKNDVPANATLIMGSTCFFICIIWTIQLIK